LEDTLHHISTAAWIPRSPRELHGAILATIQDIAYVESLIMQAAGPMVEGNQGDERVRFHVALITVAAMRYELEILFEAAARVVKQMLPTENVN